MILAKLASHHSNTNSFDLQSFRQLQCLPVVFAQCRLFHLNAAALIEHNSIESGVTDRVSETQFICRSWHMPQDCFHC